MANPWDFSEQSDHYLNERTPPKKKTHKHIRNTQKNTSQRPKNDKSVLAEIEADPAPKYTQYYDEWNTQEEGVRGDKGKSMQAEATEGTEVSVNINKQTPKNKSGKKKKKSTAAISKEKKAKEIPEKQENVIIQISEEEANKILYTKNTDEIIDFDQPAILKLEDPVGKEAKEQENSGAVVFTMTLFYNKAEHIFNKIKAALKWVSSQEMSCLYISFVMILPLYCTRLFSLFFFQEIEYEESSDSSNTYAHMIKYVQVFDALFTFTSYAGVWALRRFEVGEMVFSWLVSIIHISFIFGTMYILHLDKGILGNIGIILKTCYTDLLIFLIYIIFSIVPRRNALIYHNCMLFVVNFMIFIYGSYRIWWVATQGTYSIGNIGSYISDLYVQHIKKGKLGFLNNKKVSNSVEADGIKDVLTDLVRLISIYKTTLCISIFLFSMCYTVLLRVKKKEDLVGDKETKGRGAKLIQAMGTFVVWQFIQTWAWYTIVSLSLNKAESILVEE
ncbi:hypothetical protein NERG_01867 [Nematocida ausubeli]|uniref:Uncharacterized protein n=1 Tax=Nematocida ausubeli (strain ATCC PRA-371 / ERTm2) TaxID=1913371 RepID=H8ZE46_NEMA1|nr:hypothetical protein NERG_01867 [Nematocida ausubeli]